MSSVAAVQEVVESAPALSVELTRVIRAARPRVFDAWTRPDVIRQWFAPEGKVTTAAETNPVEGGAYGLTFQGTMQDGAAARPNQSANHKASVRGMYTKVQPFDLIQFTWEAEWSAGESSLVTIHFREVAGGTEIRLMHEKFASVQSRDGHAIGWDGCLAHLAAFMSN
jgi:uncharacterized protein YndB with AHSA1/START domain